MAFYVRLEKLRESGAAARYRYTTDGRQFGEVELDKRSGDVRTISLVAGAMAEHVSARAAARLRTVWRNGEMPQVTEWAS